jgi:trigger factor
MSTADTAETPEVAAEGDAPEKPKLTLDVKIDKPSACERHVTVTVSRDDVERYVGVQFNELAPKAELPGFRPGRAPRKLVEKQFKDQVHEQVKGKLLMDSLTQISDEHEFSAISEPDFDFDAVKIPEDAPLVFEFDIEVRPEFDLPQWKGLRLKRAVHEYSEPEIDAHLNKLLARFSTLVPQEGPVEAGEGQFVKLTATFLDGDAVVSVLPEEMVEVRPTLSFADGKIHGFDQLMIGKQAGDTVETTIKLSADVENEALRGKELTASLQILEVKHRKLPELDDGFLDRIGGFRDEAELRDEVRKELERQLKFHQQRMVRQQITGLLTVAANWELPKGLLKRQARRELERYVMELQASGFTPNQINASANELRQNIMQHTALSLKEHFILERIAEDEKIEADPADYDSEIELIAEQMDETPRKVRARLEKRGQIDTLRNQIVERKVIDLINEHATFEDVPYERPKDEVTAVSFAVGGTDAAANIPEAKHAGSGEENVPGSHVQERK